MANAAIGTQQADDVERHVLGIHAGLQLAGHVDAAHLHWAERHRLRGQHVAHLRGADTEGDRAKRAVRGGVAVTAGDGRAGLRDALFWADDVHDALLAAAQAEVGDAELLGILVQLLDHLFGQRIGERRHLAVGRHDMVHGREGAVRIGHLQIQIAQHAEGLRAGHFVHQMCVDEELRLAITELADGVRFPDFGEQCLAHVMCALRC